MCLHKRTPPSGESIRKMLSMRELKAKQVTVATALGVTPTTIGRWYAKADALALSVAAACGITDEELEIRFNGKPGPRTESSWPIDLRKVVGELEMGRTIDETYEDYCKEALAACSVLKVLKRASYFQRVGKYRRELQARSRSMLMVWKPKQYMQIDLAGDRIELMPGEDGKRIFVRIFVAYLPATAMVFAWALPSATTTDWNEGIVKAFNYFGGRTDTVLCDNDTALVKCATPGCQVFTAGFEELSRLYGFNIECARPGTPTDKAGVELAVGRITRKFISRVKPRTLKTIEDVQHLLSLTVEEINSATSKLSGVSPWDDFRTREQPLLAALPNREWTRLGVRYRRKIDGFGCVRFDGHLYLASPDYDLRSIDVVEGGDGMLHFMKPGTSEPLWKYERFKKGVLHPTEGNRHAKEEFRAANELTPEARLRLAQDRLAAKGDTVAKFASAYVKAHEHQPAGMVAQQLNWIYVRLKGVDDKTVELAAEHALGSKDLDKRHFMVTLDCIGKLFAKPDGKTGKEAQKGACLREVSTLVPPAPKAKPNEDS